MNFYFIKKMGENFRIPFIESVVLYEHNSSSHCWWNSWPLLSILGPQSSFPNMSLNIFFQIYVSAPKSHAWATHILFSIQNVLFSLSMFKSSYPSRANSNPKILPYLAPLAAMISSSPSFPLSVSVPDTYIYTHVYIYIYM